MSKRPAVMSLDDLMGSKPIPEPAPIAAVQPDLELASLPAPVKAEDPPLPTASPRRPR